MGKKGKGNKLAKMSEEERARYLQMRADIEEEARRRKMQLISLYMKNKLKREDAFCRLNMAKINQDWRSMLRHVKCDDLREEMLEVEKCFKEALECKERVIQRLLNDLDVAEDMYATLEQSHIEMIDRLIGIHKQRVEHLREAYEHERGIVLEEHMIDFEDFKEKRALAQEQLECVMYQLEDKNANQLKEQYEKYLQCLDDVKSGIQYRLEKTTRIGEQKLELLWQEYQNVLSGYVKHTESFYAEYMDLKEREEEYNAVIKDQYREIQHSSEQLAHLKLVALDVTEKSESKINYLLKIKNDLYIKFTLKKDEVDSEIRANSERFKFMSVESHYGLKHLKGIFKKGEILLQLSLVCRKYETEREKILPLSLPPLTRRMFEEDENDLSLVPRNLKDSTVENWHSMEKFWKRVNNASIDIGSLKQEKRKLEQENLRLKALLQEYLINVNISNGSNLHVNEYLSKRPSSMRVDRVCQLTPEPLLRPLKSHSAKSDTSTRRRLLGRGGIIPGPNDSLGSGNTGYYRRRPFTNIIEANLTNAVRSERLVRGKPQLAKIESFVNWGALRRARLLA